MLEPPLLTCLGAILFCISKMVLPFEWNWENVFHPDLTRLLPPQSSSSLSLSFGLLQDAFLFYVGNNGIMAVGEHCHSLTDLSLRFCDRVQDEALIAIGQGCPLQHLNVSGCNQIGDAGIVAIARGCPQLTCLDVRVLQNLGDMALAELGEGCPLLKDIVLSHCHQITDTSLSYLVINCQMLESCHMVYCPSITAAGVATVVTSCPNIKKVLVEKWKVSPRTKRRAGSVLSYLCVDL